MNANAAGMVDKSKVTKERQIRGDNRIAPSPMPKNRINQHSNNGRTDEVAQYLHALGNSARHDGGHHRAKGKIKNKNLRQISSSCQHLFNPAETEKAAQRETIHDSKPAHGIGPNANEHV